jgi:hypothetical protein
MLARVVMLPCPIGSESVSWLTPKAFFMLEYLVGRPGRLVTIDRGMSFFQLPRQHFIQSFQARKAEPAELLAGQ